MDTVEFSAYNFLIVVKDNRNERKYAKSAEYDGLNLRKLTKTPFLANFDTFGPFWGQNIFFFKNPKTSLFSTY